MVDTFICGSCQLAFHDIGEFLQHKDACCEETTQQQQIQAILGTGGSTSALLVQAEGDGQQQNVLPLEEVQGFSQDIAMEAASEVVVEGTEGVPPSQQEYKTEGNVSDASTDGRFVQKYLFLCFCHI